MKKTTKNAIFVLTMAVVFFVCALPLCTVTDGVAYAVLPESYTAGVQDVSLDWYFGEDFLDLATLKTTVATWFEDGATYDFSSLEENPIVVAVIDTGINPDHELFTGKYDADGKSVEAESGEYDVLLRDAEGNIISTNTVIDPKHKSDSILDDSSDGHGTHVAGTIATLIHALNLEKYIKILPIKAAYPATGGSTFALDSVKSAIAFALEHGADVVNMSFTSNNSAYGKAITRDMAERAVFVAAAGNDSKVSEGSILAKQGYPAASANVIGVMNATHSDSDWGIYSSSNYGDIYQLAAPGFEIYSADAKTTDGYKKLKGTSMAAPFVSFGAALASMKYAAIEKASGNGKTPVEIAAIVKSAYEKTVTYKKKTIKIFDLNKIAGEIEVYAVSIACDENLATQTIGQVESVKLTASILPSVLSTDDRLAGVKWYFVDENDARQLLGEGKEIEYTPSDAVGQYVIVAEVVYEGKTVSGNAILIVEYVEPDKETTKIDVQKDGETFEGNSLVVGEKYSVSLENYQNFDEATIVYWYLNGEYVGSGFVLNFTPNECGEYVISAKVNDEMLDNVFSFKVTESDAMRERTYAYVSIGIAVGMAVGVCIGGCVMVFMRKKSSAKVEDKEEG